MAPLKVFEVLANIFGLAADNLDGHVGDVFGVEGYIFQRRHVLEFGRYEFQVGICGEKQLPQAGQAGRERFETVVSEVEHLQGLELGEPLRYDPQAVVG